MIFYQSEQNAWTTADGELANPPVLTYLRSYVPGKQLHFRSDVPIAFRKHVSSDLLFMNTTIVGMGEASLSLADKHGHLLCEPGPIAGIKEAYPLFYVRTRKLQSLPAALLSVARPLSIDLVVLEEVLDA